ncbi:COG4315 family predicted lipoprotein [Massilia niastensis]|uniref:COG4315 family predicted lipoprotein n=1 Tax=Massilia niastensis TaxID=544911 RepID=UPI0003A5C7C0|nr:lipoprotein [Massilia niastensis]
MKPMRCSIVLVSLLLAGQALAADATPLRAAKGVLVDAAGKTVYTYDKDESGSGKSSCVAMCAKNWPPVSAEGATPAAPYSAITRDDGSKQLAHDGKPLYTFIKDKKEGDRTGDGVGGVWHVVNEKK